jgi:hypothetical protein
MESKPLGNVTEGARLIIIGRLRKHKGISKYTVGNKSWKYKNLGEDAIRNFLKGLLSTLTMFNLTPGDFNSYSEIVDFVKCYNPSFKITELKRQYHSTRVEKIDY